MLVLGQQRTAIGQESPDDRARLGMQCCRLCRSALRLMSSYLEMFRDVAVTMEPDVRRMAVTHVHDLLALALGATREAEAIAKGRGLHAARLRASRLISSRPSRAPTCRSSRSRRTTRSRHASQMLSDDEGITFSAFVL